MGKGILSAITVVDMTEGVAGPYAAMLLGDMGANVIKVERPDGDWSRTAGKGNLANVGCPQFVYLNKNKRNLGVDLGQPGASEIIERLIASADVVLSNYRTGVMARLGFDYERCRMLRPDLVYCTVSGFGQDGPYAQRPASDTIIQALSGVMSLVGEPDGPPLRVGFPLIDMTAANHAVQAILLALFGRLTSGSGAQIDISLVAAAVGLMGAPLTDYLTSGRLPDRQGNQNATLSPAGAFRVAGGRYITVAVLRDSHWRKFCEAMGLGPLITDPRFAGNPGRVSNRAALNQIIAPLFETQTSEYWLERLSAADILCGPINTIADVAADPVLMAGLPLVDPGLPGVDRIMGAPIRFNGAYFDALRPPPSKGQHTREILAELGYDEACVGAHLAAGRAFVTEGTP